MKRAKGEPTFESVWAKKEAEGYQYGRDALEQVRFGWRLAAEEYRHRQRELEEENARLTKVVRGWTGADEADAAYAKRIRAALVAAGLLKE